jgi:hypothetical protein
MSTWMAISAPSQVLGGLGRCLVEGLPVAEQHDGADLHRGPSSRNGTPDRPAAATRRPQFGSPPCTAVFTSSELAMVRAARFALAGRRRPSPYGDELGRPFAAADDHQRQRTADGGERRDQRVAVAVGVTRTPLAPLASASTMSFVEASPSTVIALKVPSATSRAPRAAAPARPPHRSSRTRASWPSSARSCRRPSPCRPRGSVPSAVSTSTAYSLGPVSVVMMARAAGWPSRDRLAAAAAALHGCARAAARRR